MYSVDGLKGCENDCGLTKEVILDHWNGFEGSRPVRIGNAAANQSQLDIYGELMDAIYLCDKYCKPVSFDFWQTIKETVVTPVLQNWRNTYHGIWEIRGPKRHYVFSKVMCWVCLDRGTEETSLNRAY